MNDALSEQRHRRTVEFLAAIRRDARQLLDVRLEEEGYEKFYLSYRDLKKFLSRAETQDAEISELIRSLPELPEPGLYLARGYFFVWLLALYENPYIAWLLITVGAPVLIPYWTYRSIKINRLKARIAEVEEICGKLYAQLFWSEGKIEFKS